MDRHEVEAYIADADDWAEYAAYCAEQDRMEAECPEDDIDPSWVDDYEGDTDLGREDMYGGWDETPYDYWE